MLLFAARKKAFKAVGATVGLASEANKARKAEKNQQQQVEDTDRSQENDYSDYSDRESDGSELDDVHHEHERQWDLDEAQDQLLGKAHSQPPFVDSAGNNTGSSANGPVDYVHLAESFAREHPLSPSYERPFLPYPVILPQRRPLTRARGFVRAYAPDLDAFGIDQYMFLDFVDKANEACRGCQALGLLNFATLPLLAFPMLSPLIGLAISVALQVAIKTTISMDGRRKSNSFFDAANRDFFIPRGLFCLVMTWNPEIDDPYIDFDMARNIQSAMTKGGEGFSGKLKHKFQKANAESLFVPETAPLIFPALDDMDMDPETRKKHNTANQKAKRKIEFAAEYRDKRAQARFNSENPDCALVQGREPEFTSRYADPRHPANEGSGIALLTGGRVTEKQLFKYTAAGLAYHKGKKAHAKHKEKKALEGELIPPETAESRHPTDNVDAGPKEVKGSSGKLHKMTNKLKKNVVYLMIVNMPSDEELQQARDAVGLE